MTKFTFEIHPVANALPLLLKLEKDSFTHLSDEERKMILDSEGFAVLATNHENEVVAGAFAVSSLEAYDVLVQNDNGFIPDDNQIYIYSVVVTKAYRRKKLGTFIRQIMRDEAKLRGYKTGATHVRMAFGWDKTADDFYKPDRQKTRIIKNFWPKLAEPDVKFMSFKL